MQNKLSPQGITIAIILLSGSILTAARIHGFSFAMWRTAIDNSPHTEVFWGKARAIRSDDWLVNIPHCIAQRMDQPPFSRTNSLIGDGNYNMIITGAAPVRDITTIFRPQVWGYFISGDIGMAFEWWFKVLGLWLACWLLLRRLTANDDFIAICGATALIFSPFCQAWSFNCAPSITFTSGILLSLHSLANTKRLRAKLIASLFFAWFGTAMLMTFYYTPYLVTLLYLVVFMLPAIFQIKTIPTPQNVDIVKKRHFKDNRRGRLTTGSPSIIRSSTRLEGEPLVSRLLTVFEPPQKVTPASRRPACLKFVFPIIALAIITSIGVYLIISNRDVINLIIASDYPGKRISTGGNQSIWHLFRGNILSLRPPSDWGNYNASEGAGFVMTFPLIICAVLSDWYRTRIRPSAIICCLTAYICFLLIWNLTGLPDWTARWTLLALAPPLRTLIGLGVADLLLLATYTSSKKKQVKPTRRGRIIPLTTIIGWTVFHVLLAVKIAQFFSEYPMTSALTAAVPVVLLAPLCFIKPRILLPIIMIISIFATGKFNPLARGGTDFMMNNPLSLEIRALDMADRRAGREPIWISYEDMMLSVLCRILGVKALNGIHAYTQTDIWRILDPDERNKTIHNRYAHVIFGLPDTPDHNAIQLVQADIIHACLHPQDRRFQALQIDYIICKRAQSKILDKVPGLQKMFSYADNYIYKVNHATAR